MKPIYFALLTDQGEAKLAQAIANKTTLKLTEMAVGDANGQVPTPERTQTQLINERRRAAINKLDVDHVNTHQLVAEQIIPEDEGGWWIHEIGLFDEDGDLCAIANCPPTYKPKLAEGSGRTQIIRLVLSVTSTDVVELKIDPSIVLATRQYVDMAVSQALLPGTLLMYASPTAPPGYLVCNGDPISRRTYAALFEVIGTLYGEGDGETTFNLPNFCGEFPRGWDNGRGVDAERVFGSHQADSLAKHTHEASIAEAGGHNHGGATSTNGEHTHALGAVFEGGGGGGGGDLNKDYGKGARTQPDGIHQHSIQPDGVHQHAITIHKTGGNETRPRNVAVLICIKY